MTIIALTTSNVSKFRGYFYTDSIFRLYNTTGNDITINCFLLLFYLPINPTLAHQNLMSVEKDINLAWPYYDMHISSKCIGLFHKHTSMTFNECPGWCFEPCPGGSKTKF